MKAAINATPAVLSCPVYPTGSPSLRIFRALLPFLVASLATLVLLAWQPWLTTAFIGR